MLENGLRKIGKLLHIMFGTAGADIVRKNLQSIDGALDPMMPGIKGRAVFMFCDIKKFTNITECLQEEIMPFVNTVGHIVHATCHKYHGSPNKNVGDAFLMSWMLTDGSQGKRRMSLHGREQAELCDSAFIAVLSILMEFKHENECGQ